jgi:hypothetical protein
MRCLNFRDRIKLPHANYDVELSVIVTLRQFQQCRTDLDLKVDVAFV